ncbi:KilA-N domain-containing protein [Thiovulum sp. ES]|nr:KilA-N domain-containing protein [Thiovulum sp. ES]
MSDFSDNFQEIFSIFLAIKITLSSKDNVSKSSTKLGDCEAICSNYLYINATQTAKYFGKLPADWLKTKETKLYIKALISHYDNIHNGDLVVVRKGGNDKSLTGTWIHKKLIITFARWLSPEFAVWCDFQIEEILSQKTVNLSRKEEVETQLVGLEFSFKHLRPSEASKIGMTKTLFTQIGLNTSYLPKYSDEEHTYSAKALLEKFGVKISVNK